MIQKSHFRNESGKVFIPLNISPRKKLYYVALPVIETIRTKDGEFHLTRVEVESRVRPADRTMDVIFTGFKHGEIRQISTMAHMPRSLWPVEALVRAAAGYKVPGLTIDLSKLS